jgi:hypothetical protein
VVGAASARKDTPTGPTADWSIPQRAAAICRERDVPFGSPQADERNLEQRIRDGFRFLMPRAGRETAALELGRRLAGR